MGGGAEAKKTNSMIDQQYQQNNADQSSYMNTVNTGLNKATGDQGNQYNSLYGGYQNLINGGGNYTGATAPGTGGGGGGGGVPGDNKLGDAAASYRNFMSGGGVDTGQFNKFQGVLGDVANNGGWNPDQVAQANKDISGFNTIADTGGVSAQDQARMRGGGVFDDFAKTGGYSDQDIANIRARSNSVIPSYYDTAKTDAARQSSVQGGYGPGNSALFARMSRDQSKQAASQALDTEVGIKGDINQNKMAGAQGMTDSEGQLQSLLSSNRLSALTGGANVNSNMANSIAQNRIGAASAGGNNEIGMQGTIQQGKEFGTSGLDQMGQAEAARAAAASSASNANAQWQAEFNREGVLQGLGGMQSLYGATPGATSMYLNAANAGRNTNANVSQGLIGSRVQNNPRFNWGQAVIGGAGAAGGLMTGIGAL